MRFILNADLDDLLFSLFSKLRIGDVPVANGSVSDSYMSACTVDLAFQAPRARHTRQSPINEYDHVLLEFLASSMKP